MKFKSIASPESTPGISFKGVKKQVVPNQALSLQEILERFTKGEPLEVGRDVQYHESDDDLEKVSHMDLVDKQEYMDKLKQTQKDYESQEKRKAQKERERLDKLAVEKLAADKMAAEAASKVKP